MSGRIVVLGTGTEIGKTHLAVALVGALARRRVSVAGLKPVESGVMGEASDTEALRRGSTFHVKHPPPYVFSEPVSPHLAARRRGVSIDLTPILAWVAGCDAEWVVLETAGAMLSPLSPALTNLDLAAALAPTVIILVAPDRLGVLHDVRVALFAYRALAPDLPAPTIVLQPPAQPDSSTGSNAAELAALGIAAAHVFPRAPVNSPDVAEAADGLASRLGIFH